MADNDLAQVAHLTQHEVAELAQHGTIEQRAAMAARADASLFTVLRLARDASPEVRAAVARNERPDMPEDVMRELAGDKSREVIYSLIYNPVVPTSVLAKLSRQIHKGHSGAARARLAAQSKA